MNFAVKRLSTNYLKFASCFRIQPSLKMSLSPVLSKLEVEEISIPMPWGHVAGKLKGNTNSEAVLCLHGWQDNCNTFDTLLPMLPPEKFYVLIDLPGHGNSSNYPQGQFYSMYCYIDLIERIRKHFSWSKFNLLGHSLGGNVSTVYSSTFPEYVERLIMIDTYGIHPYSIQKTPEQLRNSIEKYHNYEQDNRPEKEYTYENAKKRLREANPNLTERSADILLERGLQKKENGSYIFSRDFRHKLPHPCYIHDKQAPHFMRRITAETLRILADDGFVKIYMNDTTRPLIEQLQTYFSNCHFEQISVPGNHHVHLNTPENVIEPISAFLQRPPVKKPSST